MEPVRDASGRGDEQHDAGDRDDEEGEHDIERDEGSPGERFYRRLCSGHGTLRIRCIVPGEIARTVPRKYAQCSQNWRFVRRTLGDYAPCSTNLSDAQWKEDTEEEGEMLWRQCEQRTGQRHPYPVAGQQPEGMRRSRRAEGWS